MLTKNEYPVAKELLADAPDEENLRDEGEDENAIEQMMLVKKLLRLAIAEYDAHNQPGYE